MVLAILQLNTHFIARYLILAFCVNNRWNGQFLRSFWSREKKSRKLAGTSRRRVNEKRKSTSGQRRDVSANSVSTSLKAKGPEIEGGSKNKRTRAQKA